MRPFMLITFEYLGFIEVGSADLDPDEVERVHGILGNIGRGILVLVIVLVEMKLSQWLFPH